MGIHSLAALDKPLKKKETKREREKASDRRKKIEK